MGRQAHRPTIKDVAALAGVSTAAVSKAVNRSGRISEETRRRVLAAADELGWSPSSAASALKNARTRTVALIVRRETDVLGSDPHFTELIDGVESELAPRGYGLLLHLTGAAGTGETEAYRRFAQEGRVDGFLLTESRIGDPRFALLRELGKPAVLLGKAACTDPVEQVVLPEPHAGVTGTVEHLVRLGHRRIAYVSGPDDRVHSAFRAAAFHEALAAAGLTAEVFPGDFTEHGAVRATEQLLARTPRPTAAVYANDSMAVCGMSTAQRLGVRVPQDLSVIGYDDLPLSRWVHPRLTTVDQCVKDAGASAARRLLQLCGEELPDRPLARAPRLVVRESTATAPPPD
ncbi:LacI family DNA-binding transcriptional regulator [Streptomyces pathocidini]|uniref:LacI family DNA-binding transcriptional regulator n=1 Tax=Streptomyces pathocidini TaxID=1650571 RepID=A0ABW7UUT9_9ACTN|nr:LacI family DNA-binding transcriptional regulator [Streptomyces pathocidini]